MNIEDLTIKEAREISSIFQSQPTINLNLASRNKGEYVIVRSRNEGINAGFLVDADETGIILREARRIWYHKPKDKKTSWYEGVSQSGLSNDSKASVAVTEKVIIEGYSVTLCTDTAKESIINHPAHEQN